MTKSYLFPALGITLIAFACSCKKQSSPDRSQDNGISQQTLAQISALGFSSQNVRQVSDGYLVEGDIVLTPEFLSSTNSQQFLRVANTEQYRTYNLVTSLPRTITVAVVNLGSAYVQGTDLAISRYNALNLKINFQRVSSGTASITIQGFNQGPSGGYITLGSSGFPTKAGNPYGTVNMNTNAAAYGSNPDINYVGSVIQHELGHCIGMRHTDYMDRSFSCGGSAINEGATKVGAVYIPGTPSGPDADSWMLACSNGGDRTFNANDVIALNYLYLQ